MKHLIRNASNARIIYEIEKVTNKNDTRITNEIKESSNKIINVITAFVSGVLTVALTVIWSDNNIATQEKNNIIFVGVESFLCLVLFGIIWVLLTRFAIPWFYKNFFVEKIALKNDEQSDIVKELYSDILQKISELHEQMNVVDEEIKKNNEKDDTCIYLNLLLVLYNVQQVNRFFDEKKKSIEMYGIRKAHQKATLFDTELNSYIFEIYYTTLINICMKLLEICQKEDDLTPNFDLFKLDAKVASINVINNCEFYAPSIDLKGIKNMIDS